MKEVKEEHTCSLCGKKFKGYGNNPEPLATNEERCCDDCNIKYVVPARLYGFKDLETLKKALEILNK